MLIVALSLTARLTRRGEFEQSLSRSTRRKGATPAGFPQHASVYLPKQRVASAQAASIRLADALSE